MSNARPSLQLAAAFSTLKQLLRSRGIGYGDLATEFAVSERTISRWFANGSITVEQLEKICTLLDIGVFDFWELAGRGSDGKPRRLTMRQELELSEDFQAIFVFSHLLNGWTPDELRREANITQAEMTLVLARLERIGVIERLSENNAKLLIAREVEWLEDGPMKRAVNGFINHHFRDMNVNELGFICRAESLKLSIASIAEIEGKFRKLSSEIRHLAHIDMSRSGNDKRWYSVLLAARSKAVGAGLFS